MIANWYRRERDTSWRQVVLGDNLLPGVYKFEMSSLYHNLMTTIQVLIQKHPSLGSKSNTTAFCQRIELAKSVLIQLLKFLVLIFISVLRSIDLRANRSQEERDRVRTCYYSTDLSGPTGIVGFGPEHANIDWSL